MFAAGRFFAALVLLFSVPGVRQGPGGSERLVWLLVDLGELACAPCSAPLEGIARALPSVIQAEKVRGILIYRDPAGQGPSGRAARIARVQWAGFARSRGLRFPVAFDDGRSFPGAAEAGVAALLVDFDAGIIRKIPGPLRPREVAEIAAFLIR
jgi:hypothetical protein